MSKTLSLRPYPGTVTVCLTREQYQKHYKKVHGEWDIDISGHVGRMSGKIEHGSDPTYLVWGDGSVAQAHELSHVVLNLFNHVGMDPRDANGEPFCYLLGQLLSECWGLTPCPNPLKAT